MGLLPTEEAAGMVHAVLCGIIHVSQVLRLRVECAACLAFAADLGKSQPSELLQIYSQSACVTR